MKLKKLLSLHDRHAPKGCLKDSFGDGFLMRMNPIFRNVRMAALEFGFQFKSERFHDYDVMSLTQLPRILKEKVIPYRNNVRALREIEKQVPGRFLWRELPPLKPNHAFHESAHGLSRSLRDRFTDRDQQKKKLKPEQDLILGSLIEESFSNACESLANLYIRTEEDHEFFYQNSYVVETPEVKVSLIRSVNRVGLSVTFRILFLSFLFANFLKTKEAMKEFDRVLEIAFSDRADELNELRAKDLATLKKVFRVGLDLDPEFTIFTNGFCLELMGVGKNIPRLMQFDFLRAFEAGGKYQRLLWVMSDVATELSP